MNKISLYDLPKDMLFKLVTTISEETEKECQRKMELIIKELEYPNTCNSCNAIHIVKSDKIIYSNSKDDFYHCDKCIKQYCSKHISFKNICCRRCNLIFESGFLCNLCYSDNSLCLDCFQTKND